MFFFYNGIYQYTNIFLAVKYIAGCTYKNEKNMVIVVVYLM
jgi:hypothetical protein